MLEYRILGTFVVLAGGRPLPLGGPKQRAVLAALLLRAGRPVTLDRLIDDLWGEAPPASAAATLQAYISQLRKQLEPDRARGTAGTVLARSPGGYVLHAEPDQIDAQRFERLHAAATAAVAAGDLTGGEDALDEAFGLWRGEPLADFAGEEFARGEAVRLAELILTATETRFDLRLERGDPGAAGDLAPLVEAHPYRERLRCQLMLALYRSGRQTEALQVAEQGRRVLAEEVGLDPGPELVELERRILVHDPTLRPAMVPVSSSGPAAGHSASPPVAGSEQALVGRTAALDRIAAALEQASAGQGSLILLTGEAGIGKTAVAESAMAMAQQRSFRTVWARCTDDEGQPALWPWAVAVRRLAAGDPDLVDRHPGVTRLIGDAGDDETRTDHGDPDAARFRMFGAVAAMLGEVAAADPVLVVVDDLQWADPASLRLAEFLAADIASMPLVIVATFRIDDLVGSALVDRLGHIYRHRRVGRIELGGLAAADVAAIAEKTWGRPVTEVETTALLGVTAGNPLFVGEVLAWLDGEVRRLQRLVDGEVPEGVAALVSSRVARLPPETRALLDLAAVVGGQIDHGVLAAVWDGPGDALQAAEPALRARHLVAGDSGGLAFAHPLVEAAVYAQVPAADRARLHLAVAGALEDRPGFPPAVVAHHYRRGTPAGGAAGAARYGAEAAKAAMYRLAYEDAANWWSYTLEALERAGTAEPEAFHEALVNLAAAMLAAGDHLGARGVIRRAIDVAERAGNHAGVAEAVAVFGRVVLWNFVGPVDIDASEDGFVAVSGRRPIAYDPTVIDPMDRALPHLDEDDPVTATALGVLATELVYTSRQHEGIDHARHAVDVARRLGVPEVRVQTLENLMTCLFIPGTTEERLAVSAEVLAIPGLAPDIEAVARMELMACLARRGDLDGWRRELGRCRQLAARDLGPIVAPQIEIHRATWAMIGGRWTEAEALMEGAYRRMTEESTAWAPDLARMQQTFSMRFHQGRLDELAPTLEAVVHESGGYFAAPTALALLFAGDRAGAERLAATWTGAIRDDWAWDIFAFAWTELAYRIGIPDPSEVAAQLRPHVDEFATLGTSLIMFGSLHRMVGMLAAAAGDLPGAVTHLRTAIERNRDARLHLDEAWARLRLAETLDRSGEDGAEERAQAVDLAERLDAAGVATDAAG